jgi:hypothetical protein
VYLFVNVRIDREDAIFPCDEEVEAVEGDEGVEEGDAPDE